MSIRGNTSAGTQAAHAVGVHLPAASPRIPSGGDTKSKAISAAIKTTVAASKTETTTYDKSIDQLRLGLAQDTQRITDADHQGAATVQHSGTYT